MSALDFSTAETTTGSTLLDLLDSFPSSTAVSSSPSIVAGAADEQNLNEDLNNQNIGSGSGNGGGISSAMGLLGHELVLGTGIGTGIGCDFRQHSSSSERSSVSASPGMGGLGMIGGGFNQYNLQTITATTAASSGKATTKNAGASSSPSAPSSDVDSPRRSRASSKSNANAAAILESNKFLNRGISPSSPLGDFRGYDLTSGTDRNSETDDALWTGGPEGMDCQYCRRPYRQPRLLFCLHSFCEDCIVAMLEGRPDDAPTNELEVELEPTKAPGSKPPPGVVRCPVCKQDSNVGNDLRFVQLLTMDYVTINMQDANAMEQSQLACESCKAKEQAVAHCFDCSSFLCPNCVNAHQYMRCFENHKVLTFDQIKEAGDGLMVHKPILCQEHPSEQIRYFCTTCKVPICAKCTHVTHKAPEHLTEEVGVEMDTKLRDDLEKLVKEGKQKVQACEGASRDLHKKLSIVQERAEQAVHVVEEVYNAYLETLLRRRDELIQEVGQEHSRVEEEIMNTFGRIGSMSEKISDALSFTERLLRCGNTMEILHTRKSVRDQLTCLIRGIPSTNVAINLRFISDGQQFQRAVKENFGVVRTEIEPAPIERVNVDELLKKINYANVNNAHSQGSLGSENAMRPQTLGLASANSFAMGTGAFVSLGSGARTGGGGGGSLQQQLGDDSTAFNNFSRIMASAVTGNSDFYGQANGHHHQGGLGLATATQSTNSASISPTSQMTSMRPTSCLPISMTNRSTSAASPVDGGFNNYLSNGGIGGSLYRNSNLSGGGGALPNLSMPPPISGHNATGSRRTPPVGYDAASGLMGLPSSVYGGGVGAVTVQTGMMGTTGSATGLTPPIRTAQMTQMQTKSRFGLLGPAQGQFNSPHGFCLNEVEEIAVADTNNHRVQVFALNGEFRCQFGIAGKEEGQLWYPRKIAYLRGNGASPGRYIVCDRGSERSRMQIFSRAGHFIKKIAIRYIDIVAGLAIDPEGRIVAVDSVTPTVFCIHESGDLVRWFDCAEYMREPSDIAVSGHEYFICDFKGHCVCVFAETGNFLRRVGCEGITNFPNGIDISDHGDVLIGDSHGNRFHVAVYRKSGELMCEFDCPYAKVSRCCGLRITREGFIVTMAKNNHNVLVLNTLFVT